MFRGFFIKIGGDGKAELMVLRRTEAQVAQTVLSSNTKTVACLLLGPIVCKCCAMGRRCAQKVNNLRVPTRKREDYARMIVFQQLLLYII